MDTKTYIKEIYKKAKSGQFTEVIQLIKGVEVKREVALNILICASNVCYNSKDLPKIDKEELYDLLNNVVCCIDTIDESQLVTYLQSIFHIIKYMCDKEWFENLTKTEFIIIPSFLNDVSLSSIEEAKQVYQTLITKLYNSIVRLSGVKNTNHNKYLLGLIKIIIRANYQINGIKETLLVAHKILNVLENLNISCNQLCKFYFIVLNELASNLRKTKDLMDIMQLLIHIFSSIISYIITAEEFQIAVTFLDDVETRTGLSFNQQEFVKSHIMFKIVVAIFPSNAEEFQTNIEICKVQIKAFKMSHKKMFFKIVRFLEEPFYQLLSYYKSAGNKNWCELPSESLSNILEFIREDVCSHLINAPTKCSCGCSLEKNYCGALKIGCQISGLLKYYLESNKNLSKNNYSEIEQWQIHFYEVLKKVKSHNCKKWCQIYREIGTYTYNIGTSLYRQENIAFVEIYQCFLKYSLEFEGLLPELLKPNLNEITFSVICEMEYKNHNVIRCMVFTALYCLLYPEKRNSVFSNWWIKSKMKIKEDSNIQRLTLVSILQEQGIIVSNIFNTEQYSNRDKEIDLLSYELFRYKTIWKSKESVMAAFSHLMEIADEPKIAKVILEIFADGDMILHDKMPALFLKAAKRIREYLKNNSDHYMKMALAVLYFYNYKNSSKETADQNLEEMERTMLVMESAKKKFEPIPKDPNDECDIVSAYSNLQLSKFTELLEPLNKCMDLIGSFNIQSYEVQVIKDISKLLIKIGFEYRLHCYSIKSIQAFEMSLKFSEIISDNITYLMSLSFLIESADVKKNFVKEMISKGDQIATLLEKDNLKDQHIKTLAIFHISKAKAYLYDDANLSFESWKIADELVTGNEAKDEFKFLRAELYIIHYKLTKSCNVIPEEHKRCPMTFKLHCAMDIVLGLSQKNILFSYELCILFDTIYELAKVYYLMRLPRDLRAYSKNSILLAQKMVNPMRCVSFLILLARSDLLTCKFDHCSVKLSGVNDIFCLGRTHPILLNEKTEFIKPDTKTVENEIERCANQIQELALDLPQHTRQYSPSSPALVVESFKLPQFLTHEKNCMCFICLSFEYHQRLLQKYHLDALFNMYNKDEKLAEEFIHGASMLYKTLLRNYDSYKTKAKSLVSESLIFNFDDIFKECYGYVLYDYSFYLMRKSQKTEALKINTKLLRLLKPNKLQYIYLYNDTLLQRLSYLIPTQKVNSTQIEIESKIKRLSLTPVENTSLQKTPTSKRSTVTVTINGVHKYSPPKRRIKKKCALFTSPSDTEDTLKKSPLGAQKTATPRNKTSKKSESEDTFVVPKTKDKRKVVSVLGTPILGDTQTPKIQIFTDEESVGNVRKSRRKQSTNIQKQLAVDILETNDFPEPTNVTKKSRAAKNVRKTLNRALIFDDNNDSLKENSDIDSSQQTTVIAGPSTTRSRLLTQKIKASTLKVNTFGASNLVGELLTEKITLPIQENNISPDTNDSGTSSVISASPEHEIGSTKLKVVLEKTRSAKKMISNSETEPKTKKNLFDEFLDSAASSSKDKKHTGAIRKSTRHRVL